MLPLDHPDRIQIAFDDHRLVANAGLLLPVTLAQHLGLRELVDNHVDLADAPGRANAGDKMLTLVASALAGGDCIDDADVLRTGGTAGAIGCVVKAPSTLGTFLRSFRWGHVRQLDRVSRELLARAWSAGAGPGDGPLTIDLDSTICETYGLAKEGARDHGYTGQRGYHPLLAIAAGTGDVLMARLRKGRANTVRGAAHFLRETVGRVRYGGARGQLTVRADSGFYAHALVEVCRKLDFVHLGGVGEDVCELSVNCGWGFSAVGFQPRQCNISVGQPQHEVRRFRYVSNFCTKSRQDGCALLHHRPPAQKPAQYHRGHTRD